MSLTNQTIANEELALMDVDALLQVDVNIMEEVADFIPMPSGSYRFNVGTPEIAEVGKEDKKAIKCAFSLTECTELANPENAEDVETITNSFVDGKTVDHIEVFMLESKNAKSAYGIRAFVTIFKKLLPLGQTATVAELMELATGASGEALIEKSSYTPEGSDEKRFSSRIKATAVVFD